MQSARVIQWIKGLAAETFVLAAAAVGIVLLWGGRTGQLETIIAFWAFIGIAALTVANVVLRHRLWVLPFAAALVALVCPLAWLERLHETSQAAVVLPLGTAIPAAIAAGACLIGSLITGRLSGE